MKNLGILLLIIDVTLATFGVDYCVRIGKAHIKCLTEAGYHWAIPRGYCSYGALDKNVVANVHSAWEGGMTHVDVYMFPCVKCGNPDHQVNELIKGLSNRKYGMIWLDVERYRWTSDHSKNHKFIAECIKHIQAKGKKAGIYTNKINWETIVGSWSGMSHLPLWYAHYDNVKNFNDFKPFGGWKKPRMKQFAGDKTVCSVEVDLNFYQILILQQSQQPQFN